MRGTWGFTVLQGCVFNVVNKISTCGVAVISNPMVCDVCVFHTAVQCLGFLFDLVKLKFDLNLPCKPR